MASTALPETLALQRLYHWERNVADKVVLTQPLGGGTVRDYTWREVLDQSRRMAAHLLGLGIEPGSRIAILSKNCAEWFIADFAIMMAGLVSVPIYPTASAATIQVSDQPVAPSSGRTASTLVPSPWARLTMICHVVPITESPLLKAESCLV